MFKYLLKTDHSQSSSLAWILLKNIKVYFKEVLTQGEPDIWKQKWKGWTYILGWREGENQSL